MTLPAARTLRAQIADARVNIYTHHPWRCFNRRALARQHVVQAVARLDAGEHDAAAEAMRAAAETVSLDAQDGAQAHEFAKLTEVGERAWTLL